MKRLTFFSLIVFLVPSIFVSCSTAFDPEFASNAAMDALEAAGTAYEASIQEAEQQTMALVSSLQGLAFDGSLAGYTGSATWSGSIEPTANLELDYVITFTDYSIFEGGVQISGTLAVAVSETSNACSGAWNTNGILIFDPVDKLDYVLSTEGAGLVLSGSLCDVMSLDGLVDVSGDAIGNNCPVSGSTANPNVDC